MTDLEERVRSIGERVQAGYGPGRTATALAGLHAKLRRRRARRFALAGIAGLMGLSVAVFWTRHPRQEIALPVAVQLPRPQGAFTLGDGSVVTPLDPSSRVVTKTVTPHLVELDLVAGSAVFDVMPNRSREFRVTAGPVSVLVLGTRFTVTRQWQGSQIEVERGRVRVDWERGQQILHSGERGSFPPVETAGLNAPGLETEEPSVEPRPTPALGRTAVDWRALARQGDLPAAYRLIHHKAKAADLAEIDDLLLAADVARGAGHAAESIPYLEKVLALHPNNSQAAVAAFTLGRVRQAELNDPTGAAAAYAEARALAPSGPLAEDALAREVEAWFRAGDTARARRMAEEYVKIWPAGSRLRAVRHFGGL